MTSSAIFIAIALIYALLKVYLEKRLAPLDGGGDERGLSDLAFAKGCSAYDIFKDAGSTWRFSQGKIDDDFKAYLSDGLVPFYVHDYLCRDVKKGDTTYHKLIFSGGRPPYL
jgi:hypothetical protein